PIALISERSPAVLSGRSLKSPPATSATISKVTKTDRVPKPSARQNTIRERIMLCRRNLLPQNLRVELPYRIVEGSGIAYPEQVGNEQCPCQRPDSPACDQGCNDKQPKQADV